MPEVTMPEMAQELLVLTVVAVVGALVGALVAMRRTKAERAFDRRLKWCEEALCAFHEAGAAVFAAHDASGGDAQLAERCWSHAIDCYEKLIPISGQKELYATPEGVVAISAFMRSLHGLIEDHLRGHGGSASVDCRDCLDKLQAAGMALASEARKHLSLRPLPEELDRSDLFQGSFRGRRPAAHAET